MFQTTNDKIHNIQKKMRELEKYIEKNITLANTSVTVMMETLEQLAKENKSLRKEKEKLEQKHKELQKQLDAFSGQGAPQELFTPIKRKIVENFEFIQEVGREGILSTNQELEQIKKTFHKKTGKAKGDPRVTEQVYRLFDIVQKEKKIQVEKAADRLRVHPTQIITLSKTLNKHHIATLKKEDGKQFLELT